MTIVDSLDSFSAGGSLAVEASPSANATCNDDFSREVFGVLGIPVDAVEMDEVVHRIGVAADRKAPFLLSTVNLNFLIASRADRELRESLLSSDLCTADGVSIVWIARLLGIPIRCRVAGSDLFDVLKITRSRRRKLSVFLFGGENNVAAAVRSKLNDQPGELACAGLLNPGFGTVESMSTDAIIDEINASHADLLAVSLGAQKGQSWLLRNHRRLTIPVRSHLGATINFQAGTVRRAPRAMQRLGLEWLWRVKEEPYLWKRYYRDGLALLNLIMTRILPLLMLRWWRKLRPVSAKFAINLIAGREYVAMKLSGAARASNVKDVVHVFRQTIALRQKAVIDLSALRDIDARFLGCLLMLRKQLIEQAQSLEFVGVPPAIEGMFRLSGFEYLLAPSTRRDNSA